LDKVRLFFEETATDDSISPDGMKGVVFPEELLTALGVAAPESFRLAETAKRSGASELEFLDEDEALPTMQDRYRVLVEQIPAVVFMAFMEGGIGEAYVSPQIEQMLGFSREEWLDDPLRWYAQIHPDDRERWSVEAAVMFASGQPLKSIYKVVARDGRIVWFQCEAKMVRRKDGRPWFIHGVGFDISELKRTEQALQEEITQRERSQKLELERQIAKAEQTESRLAAIVESSDDAIIGKDLDGKITSWNATASRMFGYEPSEILGRSVLVLIPPERQFEEPEILNKLRRGEHIEHQITQRIAKDGTRLDVSLTISPIRDKDGRVVGASKIARDMTQTMRAEERLRVTEKLAATGRLASTIAHEINNPLEAITNILYLLRNEGGLTSEGSHLLQMADEELRRVSHMTKQALGFYRDTSSQSSFSVSGAIENVLAIYARRIANSNVKVESRLDPEAHLLAFPGEFQQVISNVLINAVDAMKGKQGRLMVRARRHRNSAADGVRITIADTGTGIPPEQKEKIFEAFFTTKAQTGTGLGLWLTRSLVQKYGGSVRMRSRNKTPRSGTVFSIFWPYQSSQAGKR
jgi:PAS domain S-box-containing protein